MVAAGGAPGMTPPERVPVPMKDYQLYGANWLAERTRAVLGDVPGLGKTRTALYAARYGVRASRVLVLGPAVARGIWEREFDRVYAGARDIAALMFESYSRYAVSATARDAVDLFRPEVIILDEFHYLKHSSSKRTGFVLGGGGLLDRHFYGVPAWALSGTPAPRNALELWPVVRAFWPRAVRDELGIERESQWLERFCVWYSGDYGPRIVGLKNADTLRAFFRGRMLRRREKDVLPELPAIRWTIDPLTVTPDAEADANEIVEHVDDLTRRDAVRGHPSANASALRHALGDIKAPFAGELIAHELNDDPTRKQKRIVFAYHRSVLDVLQTMLARFGVARVDGSTPVADRALMERVFQEDPGVRVFLGQTEAAGVSLTLTAAHRVDIVEPDWRTDFNVQAGKRAHRIGQEHPVWVRMLSMDGTLDDAIVRQHHREVRMVERIVDSE